MTATSVPLCPVPCTAGVSCHINIHQRSSLSLCVRHQLHETIASPTRIRKLWYWPAQASTEVECKILAKTLWPITNSIPWSCSGLASPAVYLHDTSFILFFGTHCHAHTRGVGSVQSRVNIWTMHWRRECKPLQYSCLDNSMNSMKRQKDMTLEDEPPPRRSLGVQYATGAKQQNSSRRNEEANPKQKWCQIVNVSGGESKIQAVKDSIA